jgi:hypothetical protein
MQCLSLIRDLDSCEASGNVGVTGQGNTCEEPLCVEAILGLEAGWDRCQELLGLSRNILREFQLVRLLSSQPLRACYGGPRADPPGALRRSAGSARPYPSSRSAGWVPASPSTPTPAPSTCAPARCVVGRGHTPPSSWLIVGQNSQSSSNQPSVFTSGPVLSQVVEWYENSWDNCQEDLIEMGAEDGEMVRRPATHTFFTRVANEPPKPINSSPTWNLSVTPPSSRPQVRLSNFYSKCADILPPAPPPCDPLYLGPDLGFQNGPSRPARLRTLSSVKSPAVNLLSMAGLVRARRR